ncbi:MAG: CTP synthase [Candidatus Pacebacteria bacterium]|nr:CTP synthase [Candidatus Paceibacterota bacterium]
MMFSKKQAENPKYIFVVGGVISGVGKGITTSSIAKILQDRGLKVTAIKIDPYINVDAGTMNPTEHGEVFVLDDGDETDQDMGNYERFLNIDLTRVNYMTTGRVYDTVIHKERNLEYGGKCVEVVPHIPMEVIERIEKAQKKAEADAVVIEVGGTVGEYQNMLFLEAARMMRLKHPKDVAFVMVSYLPVPSKIGEMKTKPTQHAVRTLNASGIQPDIIIARSNESLDEKRKEKLSMFCNVAASRVISAPDVESIYDIPANFEKENLSDILCDILFLTCKNNRARSAEEWDIFTNRIHSATEDLNIAVVGKYFDTGNYVLADAYISVIEAARHAAYSQNRKPVLTWINAVDFEKDPSKVKELAKYDGIIVPGGFGIRGIEGIISAVSFARENKIPYLGLCYGMQLAVIEFARHVVGWKDASTREVDPKSAHLVIDVMESQKGNLDTQNYGGTMRLGAYDAYLGKDTIARDAYGAETISERHRHRYEVNNKYIADIEKAGMIFSGKSPDGKLMEIAELPKSMHPFFLGSQFHPEFKSRPLAPHKLFVAFMKAAIENKKK